MKRFFLIFCFLFITCQNPNEPEIFGCTDSTACNYNSSATVLDIDSCQFSDSSGECCFLEQQDECGICNGDGIVEGSCDCEGNILDECGICNGGGIAEGECNCLGDTLDCNDECGGNAVEDCNGECGGSESVDVCGVCGGDGTSCIGCDGVANSGLVLDECGICDGEGLNSDGCCAEDIIDCNGVCGGNAEYNQCAECDTACSCELGWDMIWNDEFDSESINLNNWNFEVWWPGQVNNEKQAYTSSTNNARLENDNLVITALRENLDLNNDGRICLSGLKKSITKKTKLIVFQHTSNITGSNNDVKEIINICKKANIYSFIDGAQAIAHENINLQDLDCDFFCFSGHKFKAII